jgi:hypothetical protein
VKKAIGAAEDFYRLRVVRVDVTDEIDIDWRDDILYRRPPSERPEESESYLVEAVLLDDDEVSVTLGSFDDSASAHDWMDTCNADLAEMTRSEFEELYFPHDASDAEA